MPSKMSTSNSQSHMMDGPSWSSPSASPSPPPPPLPPPVATRWARTEQISNESCPHCRGRLASLPTRTTSLSSYSCKDRSTPIHRPPDDEDSFPVLHERELHSLHRNIPALRRRDVDTATIKQHYYPEGGWGWLVCGASFLAHLLTSGIQLAYGLLYLYTMKFLLKKHQDKDLYILGAESDKIPPEETPPFNTELVWEIEKKELRKIRSANQPLRVECITTDPHNRRERVGFALLSLRSAHIVPQANINQEVAFSWHKLIGCQTDKKKSHPELYMSLALRDHLESDVQASTSLASMPYISEEETSPWEETPDSKFPIKYFEDGHIQIGDCNGDETTFYFNLLVKEVINLDTLLPEILVFRENKDNYFLSFKILGIAIRTKPFRKELHNSITLDEKIVVTLLSDRENLEEFFSTQKVTITFYCGRDRLGITELDLAGVFNQKDCKCFFKFPSPNGFIPYAGTDKSPCIQTQTWIDEKPAEVPMEKEPEDKPKTKTIFSNVPKFPTGSGDNSNQSIIFDKLETVDLKALSDNESSEEPKTIKPIVTKSVDTVVKNIPPPSPKKRHPFDIYQKYIFELSLKYLIWENSPGDTKIMFKFLHPKAASCITILTEMTKNLGEEIYLDNLCIKIAYVSTPQNISNLLNVWLPKLVLADITEKCISEEQELNANCLDENGSEYEITLKATKTLQSLARVAVNVSVKKVYLEEVEDYDHLHLLPIILDEVVTVKEISDLEKWKQQEKNRFEEEINDIKSEKLKKLEDEWGAKKEKLEERLHKTIKKCKGLQEELVKKVNNLKTEKCLRRKQNNSNIYEDIFKENWAKFANNNTKELIEALSRAQRDNEHLKDIVDEQRQKLATIEKSTLTKSQTSNLLEELRILEEKFVEAQNAKSYFKEQWKRACEEIHELKTEDMKNLQIQIKRSKELCQLGEDEYQAFQNEEADEYEPASLRSASAWMGALCLCVSFVASPLIVAICRRKSTRLAAVLGGLVISLACLFTSFAVQFHQALLSYGLVLGIGAGVVRETSTIVLGHYFKRRREFVEMVAQTGTGVGIALFSVLYKEAIGKLGWRLGLQSITGLLALAFFLPIVYRSANLYHPQRSAITHLKNQRKKMKEKKSHTKIPKPPMFDFSPLRSRGLRVLMTACAFGALGIYAPIFYLIYQGYKEGLEDSGLVVLQTFMGFASALGCVGFGLVIVRPSTQCLISRQYLCQAAMVGIGISLLALSAVQGYHGYVLFVWLYGICLGGFTYSLKMFTLERVKGRHFTKAWSFIQGAKSLPVLIGIPITGYINQTYPKAGYYFSFVTTIIGASLMFLVGTRKDHNPIINSNSNNCNLNNCAITNLNDCVCPLGPYNTMFNPDVPPYSFYRQGSNNYDRIFANYGDHFDKSNFHRHSHRQKKDHPPPHQHYLPKSLSYAANIDHSANQYHQNMCNKQDCARFSSLPRTKKCSLRPSKSVPEGLARWEYCRNYRRPIIRNIQVIEQITTSV